MKTSSALAAVLIILASCASPKASVSPSSAGTSGEMPSAAASADAPAGASLRFDNVESGTSLEPGTYVLPYATIGGPATYPTLTFEFTLARDGWQRVAIDGLLWNDNGSRIGFFVADNLFADPCDASLGMRDPPVGPTIDELARALDEVPGWSASDEWDTYHGRAGIHVSLTPDRTTACNSDEPRLLRTPGFPGFATAGLDGDRTDLWLFSIQGTRVIIYAATPVNASQALVADVQAVVDSIRITP